MTINKIILIISVLFWSCFLHAETKTIIVENIGQACMDNETNTYSSMPFLSTYLNSDYIFIEFNISSLKETNISSAKFSITSAVDVMSDVGYIFVGKAKINGTLSGNAADDANQGVIQNASSIITKYKQMADETTYTIDVTSYLRENKNSDYFGIVLGQNIIPPMIYGYNEEAPEKAPSLNVTFNVSVPETATAAFISGLLALALAAYTKRR